MYHRTDIKLCPTFNSRVNDKPPTKYKTYEKIKRANEICAATPAKHTRYGKGHFAGCYIYLI
jgi:hypothetical protein